MTVLTRFADQLEDSALTVRNRYPTPLTLGVDLDDRTVRTSALNLIDQHLVDVADGVIDRLIISIPPQEGKSQLTSRRFPTWSLLRNPNLRIGVASYEAGMARRWGRVVRNDLIGNPQLGLKIAGDTAAAHEWTLDGYQGGVYSVGIGGALTGRPLDLLIIDDPVKDRAQAESEAYRGRAWDWWTDAARTRLTPGAPVVLIMTRWHEADLAGKLLEADDEDWTVINIPAQADHDPGKGERDPLGRAPGEFLTSARGRTERQWESTKIAVGSRTWAALYQGRPAPVAGDVFQRQQWARYDLPRATQRDDGTWWAGGMDEVIQSWDMAFKDTKGSDYVVGQVWGRKGADAYLLHQVRGRFSFTATVEQVKALAGLWPQARRKLVEDKANGPAVIDQLKTSVPGLVPVDPGKDSKLSRALSVTPFVEAGNVWLPADRVATFDVQGFINEAAAFPNSSHDDQVDAASQALNRLLGHPVRAASVGRPRRAPRMPTVALAAPR